MTPEDRGAATRARLVAAGTGLLDDLPLERLLAGVPTAAVARAAGVTTGSFFHHFPTAADFARAVVLSYLEDQVGPADPSQELLDALAELDLVGIVRAETARIWHDATRDDARTRQFRVQLHLTAHHAAQLDDGGDLADVAAVLRHRYRTRAAAAEAGWTALYEQLDTEPVPPFTLERASTALTALLDGLLIRHAVDPDAVDDALYADICGVLAAAVNRATPAQQRRTAQLAGVVEPGPLSPQARRGAQRRRESRQRISVLATGMFHGGWEDVAAADVAERAGVATQTVFNQFQSVRTVAAMTFARHVPALRAALDAADLDADPRGALASVLGVLATAAASDPQAARALLDERLVTALEQGDELGELDIRLEVPLAELVGAPLLRMPLGGADPLDVATTLINFVLGHAAPRRDRPGGTVELALRLVPDPAGEAARALG